MTCYIRLMVAVAEVWVIRLWCLEWAPRLDDNRENKHGRMKKKPNRSLALQHSILMITNPILWELHQFLPRMMSLWHYCLLMALPIKSTISYYCYIGDKLLACDLWGTKSHPNHSCRAFTQSMPMVITTILPHPYRGGGRTLRSMNKLRCRGQVSWDSVVIFF